MDTEARAQELRQAGAPSMSVARRWAVCGLPHVHAYCDGACAGNPGPMGWGVILVAGAAEREISGGLRYGTNNQAELRAIEVALWAIKVPCQVTVHTDSQATIGWLTGAWKRKKFHIRRACRNVEGAAEECMHAVEYVYEHDSNPYMARADALAKAEAQSRTFMRGA